MDVREVASRQPPVASPKIGIIAILAILVLCGCSGSGSHEISRIALLAPFEGRYREVGYNAYYAVRLALMDAGKANVELLAIDDGGSVSSAVERAKGLAKDPLVKVVLAVGYAAAEKETQDALGGLPVMIVGQWGSKPEANHIYMLASAQLSDLITAGSNTITDAPDLKIPVVGGDVLALEQFSQLRQDTDGIKIVSSASLPDEAFRKRYLDSGLFVPEPGLLATLTYDAANMALQAIQSGDSRAALTTMTYIGINGAIHFENGYWAEAPIYYYCYEHQMAATAGDAKLQRCAK